MSTWGERLRLSIFGGSHSRAIGVTMEGLPAGEFLHWEQVLIQMRRRAPGQDKTATPRKESDLPDILSGIDENYMLTGDPVSACIYNGNQHSKDYESLRHTPRPGHADYPAYIKYHGKNDIRGGGHFSGRLTAPLVFAGAVCRQLLERRGIVIGAHVLSVGGVPDQPFDPVSVTPDELRRLSAHYFPVLSAGVKREMAERITEARSCGDSLGGVVECAVLGLPVGLGTHMFGGVENVLSSILFGIPAVKGIEFGKGFRVAEMTGSENNDSYCYDENGQLCTETNHSGGVLGGMANGMPLVFRLAFKPTPSIATAQPTVNLQAQTNVQIAIKGRHDPCIVPRAAPAVEAAAAVAVCELMLREGRLS